MFSLCSRSVIFYQIQLDDTYIDYLIYYSSADVWKNCLVAYDLFFCITFGDQIDGYLMESDDRRTRTSEIQRFHDWIHSPLPLTDLEDPYNSFISY